MGSNRVRSLEPFIVAARTASVTFTEEQVRDHLNLFGDDSYDTMLLVLTDTALHSVEDYLGEFLEATTIIQPYKCFADVLCLAHSKITSVTSVKYRADDGTEKTIATSVYLFDTSSKERVVKLRSGQQWPTDIDLDYSSPVSVTYVAQWVTPPSTLTHAILLTLGDLFESRNNSSAVAFNTVPTSVRYLIDTHVRRRF